MTTSFLLSGSGGQGVITMAILLAQAAALYENRLAVQSQSYGPEARGGATRSDVIISDEPIMFPKVIYPHVLVSLTNQSCGKYLPLIRPNGIFLYDTGLVQPMRNTEAIYVGVNMFDPYMEKFHRSQMYNICVLGVLLRLTKIVSYDAVKACLKARFKPAFHAANEAALEFGRELAKDIRDPALDM